MEMFLFLYHSSMYQTSTGFACTLNIMVSPKTAPGIIIQYLALLLCYDQALVSKGCYFWQMSLGLVLVAFYGITCGLTWGQWTARSVVISPM